MKRIILCVVISALVGFVGACSKNESVKTDSKVDANQEAQKSNATEDQKQKNKTDSSLYDETIFTEQAPVDPKEMLTPLESIKKLDGSVEGYHLGQNLTPEQIEENTALKRKIIRGTFDIQELCRLSLGSHWDGLSETQRKHFVGLMTKLLETKAIFSKEQLRGDNKLYTISYNKEVFDNAEKNRSTVTTKMKVPKEKMDLDITYKLLLTPYGWKIFDVIVDEASLLSNYKFQFDRIIKKSGFDDLISRMELKLGKISK